MLAGEETCTKHSPPSSLARELGPTPAPEHAATASGQREAFSLSIETSLFAAAPDFQKSLMSAGTSGGLDSIPLLKQGQPERAVMNRVQLGFGLSKDGDSTVSLGSKCLTTLTAKPPPSVCLDLSNVRCSKPNCGLSGSPLI